MAATSQFMSTHFLLPVSVEYSEDSMESDKEYVNKFLAKYGGPMVIQVDDPEKAILTLGVDSDIYITSVPMLGITKDIFCGSTEFHNLTEEHGKKFEAIIKQIKLRQLYLYSKSVDRAEDTYHYVKIFISGSARSFYDFDSEQGYNVIKRKMSIGFSFHSKEKMYNVCIGTLEDMNTMFPYYQQETIRDRSWCRENYTVEREKDKAIREFQEHYFIYTSSPLTEEELAGETPSEGRPVFLDLYSAVIRDKVGYTGPSTFDWRMLCFRLRYADEGFDGEFFWEKAINPAIPSTVLVDLPNGKCIRFSILKPESETLSALLLHNSRRKLHNEIFGDNPSRKVKRNGVEITGDFALENNDRIVIY